MTISKSKTAAGSGSNAVEQLGGDDASRFIDERIDKLGGWRGQTLARMRALILEADPGIAEEVKWRGTPVWSHDGIVCTGETYAKVVKLTFANGASLPDPAGLFNSSLEGNMRRAIDIAEGETIDGRAFQALIKAAVAHNGGKIKTPTKSVAKPRPGGEKMPKEATRTAGKGKAAKGDGAGKGKPVKLLTGGNPQIAKGEGDEPVQAYIDAMPEWKREIGKRLDEVIVRNVPKVRKAVKWNSPFYGVEGKGWFLSFHVFTRYVKVTFFKGTSLKPVPPGGTPKSNEARWIDIYESDEFDEAQMAKWVKQAAAVPGWMA